MKVRQRMLGTLVLLAIPMIAGANWARYLFEWRERERGLLIFAEIEMIERNGLERCEANPSDFPLPPRDLPEHLRRDRGQDRDRGDDRGRERRPPPPGAATQGGTPRLRLATYRLDFQSDNKRTPPFPADLRADLEKGGETSSVLMGKDGSVFALGWRTPWPDGPAAIILVTTPHTPELFRIPILAAVSALAAALLATVWFAMGPLIGRTRKLAHAVQRNEEQGSFKDIPEEGSDELTDLARAFNSSGASLRKAMDTATQKEAALRSFVENTAHDVGTPLTVLQGYLARMAKETNGDKTVLQAMEEAQYIGAMLANLSTVARLEDMDTQLRQDRVDLKALCLRVMARHQTIAAEKEITLEHGLPHGEVFVLGEMTLLEQALSNLLHNAVRHGETGGHATLHLRLGPSSEFSLRVLDDGPGIDADTLKHLTERRWRSEEARRRHPNGRGLGLSIAEDVAERHGFELRLAKSEAGGLEVTITGELAPS